VSPRDTGYGTRGLEESERITGLVHCSQSVYSGRKHAEQLEVQALSNAGAGVIT